jgi:hypothetical protein
VVMLEVLVFINRWFQDGVFVIITKEILLQEAENG